jgi:large subunit ribosomal protein L30
MAKSGTLKVTLTGSSIGCVPRQRETLRGLGLTRSGKTVTVPDTAASRGMIARVAHLVRVES